MKLALVLLLGPSRCRTHPCAEHVKPTTTRRDPYNTVSDYFKLRPDGRGDPRAPSRSSKDGKSIWSPSAAAPTRVSDRATGKMSAIQWILKFDPSGKLVTSSAPGCWSFRTASTSTATQRLGD